MSLENVLFGRMQMQHLSITNLIQWGDHLSVDHPGIDAQHKVIFGLGAKVYEQWRAGGLVDELRPIVDKLANVLLAHFSYEERLLADIAYDGLKLHAAEHSRMMDEMEIIHDRFHTLKNGSETSGGSVLAPGWQVMQFILGVTIGHVMTSDMSYCRALVASWEDMQGIA